MENEIKGFMDYLAGEKGASKNTQLSYERDINQLKKYLEEKGITDVTRVTRTVLNSYVLYLEKEGRATTTISRMLASIKAFFHYEFREGVIKKDPAELLKAPKIEKKAPVILSVDEVNRLLAQPEGKTPKEIRDKAMLELLYATGIRVSELIGLKLDDINMNIGFITCRDERKERTVPFGKTAKKAHHTQHPQAQKEPECRVFWAHKPGKVAPFLAVIPHLNMQQTAAGKPGAQFQHRNPNRADPRQQRGRQWQAAEGIQCTKAGPARQKHRPMGCAAPGDLQRKVRGTAHGKQHQLPRRSQTVETNRHTNAPCTVWKNDPVILCHSMCRGRSL